MRFVEQRETVKKVIATNMLSKTAQMVLDGGELFGTMGAAPAPSKADLETAGLHRGLPFRVGVVDQEASPPTLRAFADFSANPWK